MTEECLHGMVGPCSLCNRSQRRARLRRRDLPAGAVVIEAGYDSRCPGCRGFINQGEDIYRFEEGEPFLCESCAQEEL